VLKDETAGDPMSEQKWIRSSLRHLMDELSRLGYWISHTTIARLLKEMKYSLKANLKRLSGSHHPDRDRQFQYIASQRASFQQAGLPKISVDTKKKEWIGNFRNAGQEWCLEATAVNDHDFEQDALGKAVPYGIYDLRHNRAMCMSVSLPTRPNLRSKPLYVGGERSEKVSILPQTKS
jgi:hypothetical protein